MKNFPDSITVEDPTHFFTEGPLVMFWLEHQRYPASATFCIWWEHRVANALRWHFEQLPDGKLRLLKASAPASFQQKFPTLEYIDFAWHKSTRYESF